MLSCSHCSVGRYTRMHCHIHSSNCIVWAFRQKMFYTMIHKVIPEYQNILFIPLIAKFMGPPLGPSGAARTQVGPMLAPWSLLSGTWCFVGWVPLLPLVVSFTFDFFYRFFQKKVVLVLPIGWYFDHMCYWRFFLILYVNSKISQIIDCFNCINRV